MHDGQATDRPAAEQEARWISFADLAARRGISRASASKLVRRHSWRRQTDNQGRVLILVPAEALDIPTVRPPPAAEGQATDGPSARPTDIAAFETALAAIEAAHGSEVAALRGQIARLDLLVETERGRLVAIEAKAAADLATASGRIEDLAIKLADVQAELADAQEAAEALRQADAERKARGRWARLRAAWRGE